jgi:hypothetical protein
MQHAAYRTLRELQLACAIRLQKAFTPTARINCATAAYCKIRCARWLLRWYAHIKTTADRRTATA